MFGPWTFQCIKYFLDMKKVKVFENSEVKKSYNNNKFSMKKWKLA